MSSASTSLKADEMAKEKGKAEQKKVCLAHLIC